MPDVLVDTSVWSLALRRKKSSQQEVIVNEFAELIRETRVRIIGPIRQEILSGLRDQKQFELLRTRLRAFPDLELHEEIFERAAEIFNACRKAGIQGSNTDFLICAVAEHNDLAIFTTDQDFHRYQKYSKFVFHEPRQ
ncbi:PIN domain-containing protein [bacterium]|nr:PIN domain-containing protein [bacterium]